MPSFSEEADFNAFDEAALKIQTSNLEAQIALQRSVVLLFLTVLYYIVCFLAQLDVAIRLSIVALGTLGITMELLKSVQSRRASEQTRASEAAKRGTTQYGSQGTP